MKSIVDDLVAFVENEEFKNRLPPSPQSLWVNSSTFRFLKGDIKALVPGATVHFQRLDPIYAPSPEEAKEWEIANAFMEPLLNPKGDT